jgi:hypothetical protein
MVVRFEDGEVKEFNPNKPRLLLDMEKRFGVQTPERHEHIAWLAHRALAKDEPFDSWVDSVEEFQTSFDEDDEDEGKDQS